MGLAGKKRRRATRDEMSTRRRRIKEIVERDQPMTVRQVSYQAVVRGIVGKAETEYDKVQQLLTDMRRSGETLYEWLIDEGRYARQPYTVQGIPQGLMTPGAVIASSKSTPDRAGSEEQSRRLIVDLSEPQVRCGAQCLPPICFV
jgi:hypothetical protein